MPLHEHKKTLVVYGCGGHARSVANTALKNGFNDLVFVDKNARSGELILNHPVIAAFPEHKVAAAIVALGDNQLREQHFAMLTKAGFSIINLVAHSVNLGQNLQYGHGNFIGEAAYLGPSVSLGDNNIINTRCIIEHECVVGSHTHIAINATLAGRCKIGDFVMLGAGSTVVDGVRINSNIIVGAGAVVANDLNEPGTYVGVPAKKIH